jgi:hypothetical protein
MKFVSDILIYAGIIQPAATTYSTGGYGLLVRNSTSGRFETISSQALLPSQSGNAGKFLKTNGTVSSWSNILVGDVAGAVSGLTGEVSTTGTGVLSVTISNTAVIGKLLTGLSVSGGALTQTDSILTAFGKLQAQINALSGGSTYRGTWNASTNTPTITSSVGAAGDYYIVSVAGTTNINGINAWDVGDWIIFDGSVWQKVDNTDSVISVNGLTGSVNLTTSNIAEGASLYYTDARARAAISLTTVGSSGAATYSAGVLNIPNYTLAGLGGVSGSGAAGQISYWSGASSQSGTNNLFWDATNNRLGVNISVPVAPIHVVGDGFIDGRLGVGTSVLTNHSLNVGANISGAAISYGVLQSGTVQPDVATLAIGFQNDANIPAGMAANAYHHFRAVQNPLGAGATLAFQAGFFVTSTLTGATNNYGYYGNMPSGAGSWNVYMAGAGNNYMAGNLLLGSNSDTTEKLQVTGTAKITGATALGATLSVANNITVGPGLSEFAGTIRSTGFTVPPSGSGLEFGYISASSSGFITSTSRPTGYTSLTINASTLNLNTGSNGTVNFGTGNIVSTSGKLRLGATSGSTGYINIGINSASGSQFNLATSTFTPTSPVNGDGWFDGTNINFRVGGSTTKLLTGSGTANNVPKWSASGSLTDSSFIDDGTNLYAKPYALYTSISSGAFVVYNASLTGANLAIGVNGLSGVALQARDGSSSAFYMQLNPFGGNVGIGINPSHVLDVNGNIGIGGTIFLGKSGTDNVIYDNSGLASILVGNTSNNANYYRNDTHVFQNRSGSNYLTINSSGLTVTSSINIASNFNITWGGVYGADIPTITGVSGTGALLGFYPAGTTSGLKMSLQDTGQLKLNGYTTTSSFSGATVGYLGFTSSGELTTNAISGSQVTGAALTGSNDTNVTISVGGNPSNALLRSASLTMGWSGQLSASRGGTGTSGLTGIIYGNGASAMTAISGVGGQILRIAPITTAYEFWTPTYLDNVMTSLGDMIYGNSVGAPVRLASNSVGTNKFLRSVSSGAPSWEQISVSDVSGAISGSGSISYLPKWTSTGALGNSLVYDNGTSVLVNTNTPIPTPTAGTYSHTFQVLANTAGGMIISTDNDSSAIGIVNSASSNKTWDISPFSNDLIINESGIAARMKFKAGGNIEVPSLSGSGVRIVVADASGVLSAQTLPVSGVSSVFGRSGIVTAQSGDYSTTLVTEGTNLYYTDARARASISLTTTGISGAATYASGVINVPNYTIAGLGGVPTTRMLSINGTSVDLSIDRSWSVGTVTSVNATVPTGFAVGAPITSSGNISIGYAAGYSLPTTASQVNWDAAYNDKINSASVTGTTTKTLTLNQQDGGVITASWTDVDTAPVTSVFGRAGTVVATSGDYTTAQVTESGNLYYTDARARASISLTTSGSSGASTYTSGVINIPNYTLSGLGGVPTSRTITINGTGLDMSADRTWSVGTITGSGSAGYIPKLTSGTNIANSLIYDNGTSVLINTNTQIPTPTGGTYTHAFQILGNAAGGMIISTDNDSAAIGIVNSASSNKTWDITPFGNDLSFNESGIASVMKFKAGGTIEMDSLVGTGTRMVVVNSVGALSTQAIPSSGVTSVFGRSGAVTAQLGDYTTTLVSEGTNLYFTNARSRSAITITTTGTSGASTYDSVTGIINIPQYSGGGITGSGTTGQLAYWTGSSSVGGNSNLFWDNATSRLGIGIAVPTAPLHVVGNGYINGALESNRTVTTGAFTNANTVGMLGQQVLNIPSGNRGANGNVYAANAGAQYFRFNGNTTLFGDSLWSGTVGIANVQFDTTGLITMADSATNSYRPLSVMQLQMQASGTVSGTVDRGATLFIQGVYPSSLTGTVTFTNYAAIRINDLSEWASPNVSITEKFGIYQAGINDRNYFAGNMLLNNINDTGQILQVTGAIRVNNQRTSSAGVASGQFLSINCDGTTYKLQLLNP